MFSIDADEVLDRAVLKELGGLQWSENLILAMPRKICIVESGLRLVAGIRILLIGFLIKHTHNLTQIWCMKV